LDDTLAEHSISLLTIMNRVSQPKNPRQENKALFPMFRSALLILSGNAFTALMLLSRNLIVARLISVEDYGIAATFAISMAIVEMMSTLGLHQLIVQDTDGNDPELQAGLQGFHLLRSIFSGATLYFLAHPIARFLGIDEIAWAYQLLALVPLVGGLMHFDIYRLQRKMVYLPSIISTSFPALLSVILILPLYQKYDDFRVMLYAVLAQGILSVIFSHLVAKRRYRLAFDPDVIKRSFRFGWPLLINNILLFAIFQGEKLIVGREMGMESLALLSIGFTLTLTPTLILAKSAQSFFLPQLSASKENPEKFTHLAMATLQGSLVNGLLLVVGIVLLGGPMVHLLLGEKYEALIPYLIWLAILHAVRVFKAGGSVVALSRAQTGNAMISNLYRVLSLALSWYVAASGGTLLSIIWIATTAEALGYITSLLLVRYRLKLSLTNMVLPLFSGVVLLIVAGVYTSGHISAQWAFPILIALFCLTIVVMKDLRSYVYHRNLSKYSH